MRSAQAQASNAYKTADSTQAQLGSTANQIGSSLIPGLEREANNPTGYTPEELNNQLVASEQGAGGANSGITGEANLRAARTRNSAGYSAALDSAARDKTKQLSQNALGIQNQNANLAQKKQQFAQGELSGLYGTDINGMLKAQGLMPEDVNAEVNASKSGWIQNMQNILSGLNQGAGVVQKLFGGGGGNG